MNRSGQQRAGEASRGAGREVAMERNGSGDEANRREVELLGEEARREWQKFEMEEGEDAVNQRGLFLSEIA